MINLQLFFGKLCLLSGLEFNGTHIMLTLLATSTTIILAVFLYKLNLKQKRNALIEKYAEDNNESAALRKYEEVGVFKHSSLALRVGGGMSLLIAFLAINYTTYIKEITYEAISYDIPEIESSLMLEPPSTPTAPPPPPSAPAPPPPAPPTLKRKVVDYKVDPEPIQHYIDSSQVFDPNGQKNGKPSDFPYNPNPGNGTGPIAPAIAPPLPPAPEVKVAEIFEVVEQMPRFPGCEDMAGNDNEKKACADQKMMQWIYSQIKYPALAREMGIEGTAVVSFVVDENGNIKDAEIRKKVGGGCEEETMRVIKEMSKMPEKWTAGKQRGKSVAVRYTLPVRFKLK